MSDILFSKFQRWISADAEIMKADLETMFDQDENNLIAIHDEDSFHMALTVMKNRTNRANQIFEFIVMHKDRAKASIDVTLS